MKERKRKITVITVIGIMLFSCVATLSYALWERLFTQSDENRITTLDCFNITYSNESAATTLNGAVPIKEDEGLKLEPYKITIKNTCDTNAKYNVILNRKRESTLDNKFVRAAVDRKTILLSNAQQIETRSIQGFDNEASYIIGSGFVTGQQTKTIEIRSWMDWETQANEGQNKTFTYKITIETGATNENPPLGDAILANNEIKDDSNLDFTKGFPNSSTPSSDITNKSGIYAAMDDDGISYYFRGKVENNYVSFAGYTWRIVRINGDGTIRLIYGDSSEKISLDTHFNPDIYNQNSAVGYTYDNSAPCTKESPCDENSGSNSEAKLFLDEWYDEYLNDYKKYIAKTTFCNDTSYNQVNEDGDLYYGSFGRLQKKQFSLKCPDTTYNYGGVYKLNIGLVTVDELGLGGIAQYGNNSNYATSDNYLYYSDLSWTMTPSRSGPISQQGGNVFQYEEGNFEDVDWMTSSSGYNSSFARPVINLKSDVIVTGSGTEQEPYVVQ